MHKQNIVIPSDRPHLESGFYEVEVHYQSKLDGNVTTDITMAMTDCDGNPLVLDYVPSSKVMVSISNPPKPLSLSPADPISRAQCLEVFGLLNKHPSSPISFVDKLEAHSYAERVSGAISRSIHSAVNAVNSSSSNSPVNE